MTETEQTDETAKPQRSKRIVAWHGVRVTGLLLGLPILFAMIGVLMMFDRDITAPSWVKTAVSERAAEALAGGTLNFGEITVRVGRDLHPRLRLNDTEFRDADGALLAKIDEIRGLLSPRGLVLEQTALFQEVTLSGAEVALTRSQDGSVALSFDQSAAPAQTAQDLTGLLDQLDQVFEQPALVALEQVNLVELGLTYTDARAGQTWRVEGGETSLDLRNGRTRAIAEFAVKQADVEDTIFALDFEHERGGGRADLAVSIENANAQDLAVQSPAVSWLSAIDAPLNASLQTALNEDGSLAPVTVALDIAAGTLRPNETAQPVAFDAAQALLTYEPSTDIVRFDDLLVSTDWGGVQATGQAILQDMDAGLPSSIVTQLELSDIEIAPPGFYDEPRLLEAASLDLRLGLDPFVVDIGQLVVIDAAYPVRAFGKIAAQEAGWAVALDFAIPTIDQADVRAWWPNGRKPRTRNWFEANMTSGVISELAGGIRIRPDAPFTYSVGFQFDETTLKYMRHFPPIENGAGYASFVDHAFHLNLSDGQILAPQGGAIDLEGSHMVIRDLRVKEGLMDLHFNGESSISAVLSSLDLPPFEFMQKANLPVTVADGLTTFEGVITFPLKNPVKPPDVQFSFDADLLRVQSDTLVKDRRLTASQLALTVNKERLEITGPTLVEGVPIQAQFAQVFGPDGSRGITGEVELSQRFLDGFDIALPPGSIGGEGTGQISIALPQGASPEFELTSDLRGLRVAIPALGWAKGPGTPGNLLVQGTFGEPARIDRLEIAGGGLSAVGSVSLRDSGGLDRARFSQVRLGNWLNAPITVRGRGRGRPAAVEIAGGALDLRRAQFAGSGGGGPMKLSLELLQITDGIALTGFRGDFDGTNGFSGQFSGRLNGEAALRGTIVPQNGRSAMRVVSEDAGGILSAAGLLRNGVGGSLDLTLLPAGGEETFDGTLAIDGLRVRDAPAIAALLDAISVVGLLQQLDGQGLAFDEVDARFRLTPRQVIVTEASAVGPGLGISLDGIYTLANKSMDFQGVISPIYLLNGIGSVLTRRGEGLIGFNFNITGVSQQPNVSVNPLSALTPGMFREIFRRAPPQVGQ